MSDIALPVTDHLLTTAVYVNGKCFRCQIQSPVIPAMPYRQCTDIQSALSLQSTF